MTDHRLDGVVPSMGRNTVPFIGRNFELDQLSQALAVAKRGKVQTVFITGEAGIGKTRLAHSRTHTGCPTQVLLPP